MKCTPTAISALLNRYFDVTGTSPAELAKQSDVSHEAVQHLRDGLTTVSIQDLIAVFTALNLGLFIDGPLTTDVDTANIEDDFEL